LEIGEEQTLADNDLGSQIANGTVIVPKRGSNDLTAEDNLSITKGFYRKNDKDERRDNFFVQSILPQSDYNYSWVTSSLGSNYSVRSEAQKVFGFWPKNGMLSSSSGFDSAISFPSASEIFGS
jgi:hypothetical protein